MRLLLVVSIVLLSVISVSVQSRSPAQSPIRYDALDDQRNTRHTYQRSVSEDLPDDLRRRMGEDYVEYMREASEHRLVTLWTQYVSSIIILVIVLGIVFFGIMMSYKQFKQSIDKPAKTTTVKIGQHGIEVSTSIIGIVILLISLVFFYLYLKEVYPISEIGAT